MPKRTMLTKIIAEDKVAFVTDLKIAIFNEPATDRPFYLHPVDGLQVFMAKLGLIATYCIINISRFFLALSLLRFI